MNDLRPGIIRTHKNGEDQCKVERFLNIPRITVQDAIKQFEETESNDNRLGRERKKTAKSKKNGRS